MLHVHVGAGAFEDGVTHGLRQSGGCPVFRLDPRQCRQTQARPGQHQVDEFLTGSLCVSVKLRGWRLPGLFELAVNSQLNAADGQQIDSCFRLARLDGVADPELPFPDTRRCRHCDGIFHALVIHGYLPATTHRT